jgi:hypothetical protein
MYLVFRNAFEFGFIFINSFNLSFSVSVMAILGLRMRIINIIDIDGLKEMCVGQM